MNQYFIASFNQQINQLIHIWAVYWALSISPGAVMVPVLYLLGSKELNYFAHSIQLWAVESFAFPTILEANMSYFSSKWLHKSSSKISQENWAVGSWFYSLHLPHPSTPAKLGTYLELVLLVPPVMLLEAKLQPRSSSWQGRAVSRKCLQGSEMMSY